MLLRLYRLTDKLNLLLLKAFGGLAGLAARGLMMILGSATGRRRGIIGLLARVALAIWAVVMLIAGLIGRLIALFTRVLSGTTAVAASATLRASGQAQAGTQRAMARRAKRAEIDATLKEDPLLTQNRMLSGLMVLTLVALIAVVLWATRPQDTPPAVSVIGPGNTGGPLIAQGTPTAEAEAVAPLAPATSIPTATQLPEVLQARGSIAFALRENGQTDLWALNVTTRTPLRITNDLADERDPALSPDGTRLAFASNRDGNWDLYIYDLRQFGDPSQPQRVTFGLAFEGGPSWSPDGSFLTYETYQNGNLDIYVLPVTDTSLNLEPITVESTGEFSPAWSPQGRRIAYSAWRDGAQDLFVFSLDPPLVSTNITNTPERHEDHPAFHPDGDLIAYSAVDQGVEKIFVKSISQPDAPAQPVGVGREPVWSPDGSSVLAVVDTVDATHLTVYPYSNPGAPPQIFAVGKGASSPSWSREPLPAAVATSGGLALRAEPLYIEQEQRAASGLFVLSTLIDGADAPGGALLSERVDDSFNALRRRVLEASGRDFLSSLEAAFWGLDVLPQSGEERRNWHYTGRAFSINRNAALVGVPPLLEVVREERGLDIVWRVYLRVDDEAAGQLGEPLRRLPWDFNARSSGDTDAYNQGGRLKAELPSGYYIDLTALAADYGWEPLPAGPTWRANLNAANYWMFHKPDGLDWLDAMLEIYAVSQLGAFAPTPTPAPIPLPTEDAGESGDSG